MKKQIKLGGQCRLKPLEWKYDGRLERWEASTVFCDVRIVKECDSDGWLFTYCVDEIYDEGSERFDSDIEAKARAEQWYLERISNALEPL